MFYIYPLHITNDSLLYNVLLNSSSINLDDSRYTSVICRFLLSVIGDIFQLVILIRR